MQQFSVQQTLSLLRVYRIVPRALLVVILANLFESVANAAYRVLYYLSGRIGQIVVTVKSLQLILEVLKCLFEGAARIERAEV